MGSLERHDNKKRLQSILGKATSTDREVTEEFLEEIWNACEEARRHAGTADLSMDEHGDFELCNQPERRILQRLNRIHQAIIEGGTPSDYE